VKAVVLQLSTLLPLAVPVVATRVGGIPEIILMKKQAFWFRLLDPGLLWLMDHLDLK